MSSPASSTNPSIKLIYPSAAHHVYEESTFLMGQVLHKSAGDCLLIEGKTIPVSQKGFFTCVVPLSEGKNPLTLTLLSPGKTVLATCHCPLYRVPAYPVLSQMPLAVHTETMKPGQEQQLSRNSILHVACSASINVEAHIVIPGFIEVPVPMLMLEESHHPVYLDTRIALFAKRHWTTRRIPCKGYYQASIPLAPYWHEDMDTDEPFTIELHLSCQNQKRVQTFPGKLFLLKAPLTAEVSEDRAVTRYEPSVNGARTTPQRSGTLVQVNQITEGWCQVLLNTNEIIYIHQDSLQFKPVYQVLPPQQLQVIQCNGGMLTTPDSHRLPIRETQSSQAIIRLSGVFKIPQPYPVHFFYNPSPHGIYRLECRFYGMQSQCDFIHYDPDSDCIHQIHWRPVTPETLEVWIDLEAPLCGYDYWWANNQWHIRVKTLPKKQPGNQRVIQQVIQPGIREIRVLIDPGHGGAETGATGLNGLPEKTLNLIVSEQLAVALRAKGFATSMTRTSDVEVSLPARQDKAISTDADIVLSIHHNALPDGRDPLQEYGTSTFYYHPFAKRLATTLLDAMTIPHPNFKLHRYGVLYDSLFIPRIHQATSVLLELGFFTHPEEFEQLIHPAFQALMVQRIADGLEHYCLKKTQDPGEPGLL
jgi:N-acetylmuramoyl-L-alanine amidase